MKIQMEMSKNEIDLCWCVYTLTDPVSKEVVFVGHCKLVDVIKTPDLRGIPGFEPGRLYSLEVIKIHNNASTAKYDASRLTTQLNRPRLNQLMATARHCQIECVETGQRWSNATDCANAQGITQSALSNHLNNKPGFVTIRGLTYRRVPLARPNLDQRFEPPPVPAWYAIGNPQTLYWDVSQTPTRSQYLIASGEEMPVRKKMLEWLKTYAPRHIADAFQNNYGVF